MSNFTIQDIFLKYGDDYIEKHNLSKEQWKVFNAIRNCGTKELGYHICTCGFMSSFRTHFFTQLLN